MSELAASTPLSIELAGETVCLLPERALWWPAARTLFIADLHLGKAASFRAQGQPVPAGTTQDNLDRLTQLISRYGARSIVFLGDFLHAAHAQQAQVMAPVQRWREHHPDVQCVLVRGNHDWRAGDPPASLGLLVVEEPWSVPPGGAFAACHHPRQLTGQTVLAGHWHPVVTLRGPAHDRQRLPCFCHAGGLLVLPAFGAFTGGSTRPLPRAATLYPVGGARVWTLNRF